MTYPRIKLKTTDVNLGQASQGYNAQQKLEEIMTFVLQTCNAQRCYAQMHFQFLAFISH